MIERKWIDKDLLDTVLIMERRYGPAFMATKRNPPVPQDQLPQLQRASDITYGMWKDKAGDKVGGIRYILNWGVQNAQTQAVIRRALDSMGEDLNYWPGVSWPADSEQAKAILGD